MEASKMNNKFWWVTTIIIIIIFLCGSAFIMLRKTDGAGISNIPSSCCGRNYFRNRFTCFTCCTGNMACIY
ncbi:DUF3923 family protein [Lentilactobacillus parabuchneri]|uniref:DUF3923 family protein n=1 Tax=Lentilactobacillus parabuchneri TaxID=152331 RepID=UPI003850CA99